MELGTLLVLANLVTVEQVNDVLERQVGHGSLCDRLVAAGYVTEQVLAAFLSKFPVEPENIASLGIDESDLLGLLIKQMYTARLQSLVEFSDAIKLPRQIVTDLIRLATERKLVYA